MKRAINILSLTVIAAALAALAFFYWPGRTARASAFAEFPPGKRRVINLDSNYGALDGLSRREKIDQLRDWLLFTVVSDAGLSADQVNQVMFDVPAIRRGYMQPVANFEYGEARSRYLGNGLVVALLPADSTADTRSDYLARIADEHRKNTGEMPRAIEVFDYRLALDEDWGEQGGEITRRETLKAANLFTDRYGYREAKVKRLDELQNFLGAVDDISFAQAENGSLLLGGRKYKVQQPYRRMTAEDVAAIWQSEDKIQSRSNSLDQRIDEFNRRWANKTYRTASEKVALERQYKLEEAELKEQLSKAARDGNLANGSGFSLDPTFDYKKLASFFDSELAPLIRVIVGDSPKIDAARAALNEQNADPLFELLGEVSQQSPEIARLSEALINDKYSFQSARYDGYLKGTEVGMVLFYTDLLAKLWALDYLNSAPSRSVEDFKAMTAISVSPIYAKEMDKLTSTRLWFGPRDKGFQVADNGKSLIFAHDATRVYAASSDPFQPGKEAEPNAKSAAFLGWWDDHYEEVARYEPQYQRLNEIMKWSLLIGWLNKDSKGSLLGFLKDVKVKDTNWFPDWAKSQPDLKFQLWGDGCAAEGDSSTPGPRTRVCFFQKGFQGVKTESLPLLSSNSFNEFGKSMQLSGGVSLAEKGLFKERVPLSSETAVNTLIRRSNLKYDATKLAGDTWRTVDGASYGIKSISAKESLLTYSARDGAKLRATYGELASKLKFERSVATEGAGLRMETRIGGAQLGELDIASTGNGFKVAWQGREIELGQSLARRLSQHTASEEVLLADPHVNTYIKLPETTTSLADAYLVKFRDSDRWLQVARETNATPDIAETWQSRVAGLRDDARNYNLRWLSADEVRGVVGGDQYLAVTRAEDASGGVRMEILDHQPPSGTKSADFNVDNLRISGNKASNGRELYFRGRDLPQGVREHPEKLMTLLGLPAGDSPIVAAVGKGDYGKAAQDVLRSPGEASTQFKKYVDGRIDQITGRLRDAARTGEPGAYADVLQDVNDLIAISGTDDRLNLLKGIAILSEKPGKVAPALRATIGNGGKINDPAAFLKEVNARLAADYGDTFSLVQYGNKLRSQYKLVGPLRSTPVAPGTRLAEDSIILVQDSEGLNNLDWSTGIHRTLDDPVLLNFGDVRQVSGVDISDFRPSMLYTEEESVGAGGAAPKPTRYRAYYFPGPSCSSDEEKRRKGEDNSKDCNHWHVYVLVKRV